MFCGRWVATAFNRRVIQVGSESSLDIKYPYINGPRRIRVMPLHHLLCDWNPKVVANVPLGDPRVGHWKTQPSFKGLINHHFYPPRRPPVVDGEMQTVMDYDITQHVASTATVRYSHSGEPSARKHSRTTI